MSTQWFAVKTLYRSKALGRPEKPDLTYDPDATLLEERVVLIKAKNRPEALRKAEREAVDYARRGKCRNPYNQDIETYYTTHIDVVEIGPTLGDKSEIYSQTRIMSAKIPDKKAAHVYIGRRDARPGQGKRKKFMNRDFYKGEGR